MLNNLVNATYIAAGLMFILALAGLSKHETAKKGNAFGILGMVFAVVATNYAIAQPADGRSFDWTSAALLYGAIAIGAAIGTWKARRVEMTGMPELIALLHSFVGLAAVLVGYNSYLVSPDHSDGIHLGEVFVGVFIGAVTFTGSVVAFLKLSARIRSAPLALPGHNLLNLGALVLFVGLTVWFVMAPSLWLLIVMAVLVLVESTLVIRPRLMGGAVLGFELDRIEAKRSVAGRPPSPSLGVRGGSDFAAAYGLTEVEASIIRLIAQGRSRSFIADTLNYSENTIRNYTRSAYRKVGVHSKQELIDRVVEFSNDRGPTRERG